MKILTLNFLTCARKACKPVATSFPLHPADCSLEIVETDLNMAFLTNILPRLDWPALVTLSTELGMPGLQTEAPDPGDLVLKATSKEVAEETSEMTESAKLGDKKELFRSEEAGEPTRLAKDLHRFLLETTIQEGNLVCANCGHNYAVKEGIANFLLPSHLV